MRIHEYQAKQLLERYGVPVPAGAVADSAAAAEAAARGLGGFVEAWSELLHCLVERAAGDVEAGDVGSVS